MPRRLPSESGVTLIEVLIAVSLLSLLSVGMLMAMRIGLNTMGKTDDRLLRNRRVSNARRIIENEIAGFMVTRAEFGADPTTLSSVPFVEWEPKIMRFVTAYSLHDAWRGRPQIAALQIIPGEGGQGVRLVVNEIPYTGPRQAGQAIASVSREGRVQFAPVAAGAGSFVLADRLEYCRFTYEEKRFEPPLNLWRPDWDLPVLPAGIRIEMAPLDKSPADLHVTSVTMPLSVNLNLSMVYTDVN